jgi:hypothetical protein
MSLRTSNVIASKVAWQILLRIASGMASELVYIQFAEGGRPSRSVATKEDRKRDASSRPFKTRRRSRSESV